jgi:hypothetical protein
MRVACAMKTQASTDAAAKAHVHSVAAKTPEWR